MTFYWILCCVLFSFSEFIGSYMTQFDFTNECLSASLIINDKEVEITEYFNNYARVKQNKGKKLNIYYLVDSKGENIVKQIDSKITVINTDDLSVLVALWFLNLLLLSLLLLLLLSLLLWLLSWLLLLLLLIVVLFVYGKSQILSEKSATERNVNFF